MSGNLSNSTSPQPHCPFPDESQASYITRAVLTYTIMVFALVGNIMVCRGACSRPNRPPSYNLVINLAVAEILMTIALPFIFHYNASPWSWIWGEFLCQLVIPLLMCSSSVIIFTLSAIAVYRCIVMLQPYRHYVANSRLSYSVVAFSWIFGITLALPSFVTRKVTYDFEKCGIKRCDELLPEKSRLLYSKLLFVLKVALPLVVMVMAYVIVIVKVKKHIRHMKEETSETTLTSRSNLQGGYELKQLQTQFKGEPMLKASSPKCEESQSSSKTSARRENKMIRLENDVLNMIYIIIIAFLVFYLPVTIFFLLVDENVLNIRDWEHYQILFFYLDLIYTVPSALHPIIYGAMSKVVKLDHLKCKK